MPIGSAVASGGFERVLSTLARGSSEVAALASDEATNDNVQTDIDQVDARRRQADDAARTVEWFAKGVTRFKRDGFYRAKAEALAVDDTQPSNQPQELSDNDEPRHATITQPVETSQTKASGLDNNVLQELDRVWIIIEQESACDNLSKHTPVEKPLLPATCYEAVAAGADGAETEGADEKM